MPSLVALPDAEANLRSGRVNADGSGNFSLAGIVLGKYRAFALESLDEVLGPNFHTRFLDWGQSLQVVEKGMARLELQLIPESKMLAAAGNQVSLGTSKRHTPFDHCDFYAVIDNKANDYRINQNRDHLRPRQRSKRRNPDERQPASHEQLRA